MTAAVLARLDGYMAAAFYEADHPWRSEIATALAVPAPTQTQCPVDLAEISRDAMRILGESAGRGALKDLDGCVDPAIAFAGWRAHCRAELVKEHSDQADVAGLVTAWDLGFDSVQPLGLAPKEMDLLEAFRLADERGRESICDYATSMAEDWPRYTFTVPCEASGTSE